MILYVIPRFEACGPVNQVQTLAKHVDGTVTILALSPGHAAVREEFRELGAEVATVARAESRSPFESVRAVRQFVRKRDPSLVHSHGFRPDAITATLRTKPTVSTLHNVPQWDYPREYGPIGYGLAPAHQAIQAGIDCSVACSHTVRKRTVWSDRTIHNGIDAAKYRPIRSPRRASIRDDLGIGTDETVFVTVGRMIERKNVVRLAEAFLIADPGPATQLLFIGDGPKRKQCERLADGTESIRVEGYVDDILPYLRASDYFISASSAEGLPLSVIEAMGCGLPALLSDIGPHREILRNAPRSGSLYDLNDAIDLRESLASVDGLDSAAARAVVEERFTGERMADEYERVYRALR